MGFTVRISRFGNCLRSLPRKNFRGEAKHLRCGIAPGIARQAGFYTGFLEQPLAGPFPFRGDLRKQKSPEGLPHHHQSMPARDNRIGGNGLQRGQDGDFDIEGCDFHGANRRETRIVQSRVDRGTGDHIRKRAGILNLPHAAAQDSGAV